MNFFQKNTIQCFYASIVLVVITAVIHLLADWPDSLVDWVSNLAFIGSVAVLLGMTLFIFRPQIHLTSATLSMMKLLKTVASAANEASSIEEGLQQSIDSICEYTGWPVGHVYI